MSAPDPIRSVVIVGGGTAGWMAAAAAARFLDDGRRTLTLIESEEIGTVGVGEATIPPIRDFNALLGVDEREFLRATRGTIKLGIEFVGWRDGADRYVHHFGALGRDIQGIGFHHLWLKLRGAPGVAGLDRHALSTHMALQGRFTRPGGDPTSPLAGVNYAYHFDAGLYAAFLRRRAEAQGVRRIEGRIEGVEHDAANGHVAAVRLADGRRIEGDLFIDCSGLRSLLLGEAMGVPFRDWSHWLPCDRALAMPCARTEPLLPYTRSTADVAGWRWRIPLQHRTGNGHVYCSAFTTDDEAARALRAGLDGAPEGEPRPIRFRTGRRERLWEGNVVALGLSGGFLEPLESTSIHLIQTGVSKLFALFPDRRFSAVERDEYNRAMARAFDGVRDFVILHYHATARRDSEFWRHVSSMDLPDSLRHKLELFREKGRVFRYDDELFSIPSWVAVLIGQGVIPEGYDPLVDALDERRVLDMLRGLASGHEALARRMPTQAEWLRAELGEERAA